MKALETLPVVMSLLKESFTLEQLVKLTRPGGKTDSMLLTMPESISPETDMTIGAFPVTVPPRIQDSICSFIICCGWRITIPTRPIGFLVLIVRDELLLLLPWSSSSLVASLIKSTR